MSRSSSSSNGTSDQQGASKPKRRGQRSFPASSFEEALVIGEAIQGFGGGTPRIRRLTLFEQLDRSPESGLARQQITNSSRYGITNGSYKAEFLELTERGLKATSGDIPAREQLRARFDLAIDGVEPFRSLYDAFKDHKLPAQQVMRDHLIDGGMQADLAQEAVEVFILNAKFLGLLRPISGTERVLSIDHVLDGLPASPIGSSGIQQPASSSPTPPGESTQKSVSPGDWKRVCFYITPIGDDDSDDRKHADVFLGHLVEPAIEALGMDLRVVRADLIDKPGLITAQVIDHVLNARLVVADLSFHNPNVFYELALRHATGKPTVQLCRTVDDIPFDIADVRTIQIDMGDIHAFVTQMETWRAELTNQARLALEQPESAANPLTALGAAVLAR